MLEFRDGGESHFSRVMTGIISGIPAGLVLDEKFINRDLRRRQWGLGRGYRSLRYKDTIEITSGVASEGISLGTPISLEIKNPGGRSPSAITIPRPGHADLVAMLKYDYPETSYGSERASARQTAMFAAFGAIAKQLAQEICGTYILSFVVKIGNEEMDLRGTPFGDITSDKTQEVRSGFENLEAEISPYLDKPCEHSGVLPDIPEDGSVRYAPCLHDASSRAQVRCPDEKTSDRMVALIHKLYDKNSEHHEDTLGGEFIVAALNVPIGLGSHTSWDRKIDGRLAQAVMSTPAVKAVEFGTGFSSQPYGSSVHDEILFDEERGVYRETNHAGGVEGGITNGEPIVMRAYVKPPSTLGESKALRSVDLLARNKQSVTRPADTTRTDSCIVHGAGVVAESAMALILADCVLEKWGSDNIEAVKNAYEEYDTYIRARLRREVSET